MPFNICSCIFVASNFTRKLFFFFKLQSYLEILKQATFIWKVCKKSIEVTGFYHV